MILTSASVRGRSYNRLLIFKFLRPTIKVAGSQRKKYSVIGRGNPNLHTLEILFDFIFFLFLNNNRCDDGVDVKSHVYEVSVKLFYQVAYKLHIAL